MIMNGSAETSAAEPGIIRMFAGKGGVGKTTCAAATALHYAAEGRQTLALSTDAAPSLSHIFEQSTVGKPVRLGDSLSIAELGETEVREMWDRKFGREVYAVFSSLVDIGYGEFIEFMSSVLPGLSDEFMVDYIRELHLSGTYRNIIWDTAPLGQTLALLETPSMLARHLRMAPRIYSKLRFGRGTKETVLDILKRWEVLSAENIEFLRSGVRFTLVTIAEALAVKQLDGIFRELDRFGLRTSRIIVNNVVKDPDSPFLRTRAAQQQPYLERIRTRYADTEIVELPMFPYELKGAARLREAERVLFPSQ
jgi:arsenite-transporting ATPase